MNTVYVAIFANSSKLNCKALLESTEVIAGSHKLRVLLSHRLLESSIV